MAKSNQVELKALKRCGINLPNSTFFATPAQANLLVKIKSAEYFTRVMPAPNNNASLPAPPPIVPPVPPAPPAPPVKEVQEQAAPPAPPPPPPPAKPAKPAAQGSKGKGGNKNTNSESN